MTRFIRNGALTSKPSGNRAGQGRRQFLTESVRASNLAHLSDGERVEAVNALKDKAFAEIKEILAGRKRRT